MKRLVMMYKYMEGNKLKYVGAIVSIALAVLSSLIVPLVIRTTIDAVIGKQTMAPGNIINKLFIGLGGKAVILSNLWIPGLLIIFLTLLRGLFLYYRGKWSAEASEAIAKRLRDKLYEHLQELSYEYHVKAETGDLIQRCTSDVDMIRKFLAVQLVEIGRSIFMIVLISIIMLNLDLKLGLISLAIIPVIFIYSYTFFKKIQKSFKLVDEAEGAMSTTIQENLTGVRVVRAFGRQAFEIEKFKEKNMQMKNSVLKLIDLFAQYWSTSDIICLSQTALVLCIGTIWTVQGQISLGTLVAFTTYMGMLLWPVRQMGRILTDMSKAFVAVDRIQEIFGTQSEMINTGTLKTAIHGEVTFENVSFHYEDDRNILDGISFTLKKGETLAILGPTGSGKSTLVHLMARLYDVKEGLIKLDGVDIKAYDIKHLRENVGLILQEPFLFAKTIKDNIKITKTDAEDHQVELAAKTAVIHENIIEFNKGYETIVGERGVSLSGGQKQRLAIARRIITDAPLVIFDDSLSAVDTETDAAIRHRLSKNNRDLTTVIISHRVSSLSEADRILVIENGKISGLGTHDELIKSDGLYKRVWMIQNSFNDSRVR